MKTKTKELTITAMLCAAAYAAVAVGRIPLVLFLKYDPKDIVIAIGGLIFGPLTSFAVAFIVSLIEMFTISENGILGFVMNVISSCSFACTAAFIYKRKHKLSGALTGLLCGWGCMVSLMLLWNYLITPLYMGCPREAVAELLLPAFLPFNLIKGGLNTALTLLIYKPVITALRRARLLDAPQPRPKAQINIGVTALALFIAATCILLMLSLQGIL